MESHHPGQSPPRQRTPRASYVVSKFFEGIPKAGPGMRHRRRIRERCHRPKDPPKVGLEVYRGRCQASQHCGKNFCFFSYCVAIIIVEMHVVVNGDVYHRHPRRRQLILMTSLPPTSHKNITRRTTSPPNCRLTLTAILASMT